MFNALKRSPLYLVFGLAVIALSVFLDMNGTARGGQKAPKPIDPNQIRTSSPGSWTYIYWAHGTRGK